MGDSAKESIETKLATLRESYISSLPAKVSHIRELWENVHVGDVDLEILTALQHAVHTLSGSGATFGAVIMSQVAGSMDEILTVLLELRRQPDENEKTDINELIVQLEQASISTNSDNEDFELQQYNDVDTPQKLIYIVEDDTHLAEKLASELRRERYIVQVFDKLTTFKQAYQQQRPGVVLMDMVFPENAEGGAEVMLDLRQLYQPAPPLIFMSCRNDMTARLAATRAGASRYLTKPLNIEKLIQTLAGLTHQITHIPYRVMIVDDDQELAEFYATLLDGAGLQTTVITNPLLALDKMMDWHPDLVMMDIYMPECNGLELATVIRQDDNFITTPIVFLSSETDIHKQLYALDLGGDAFLTKPVEHQHLVATVIARAKRSRWLTRLKTDLEDSIQKNEFQRKEIEIKEERLRFSQYFANIGSWDLDVHTRAMHWSEKIAPLLGYAPDTIDASYEAFLAAVHPDDQAKVISTIETSLSSNTAYEIEYRVIYSDGSVHWLLQKGDVLRDDVGKAVRMLGIVQDTTRRKQLESELATQKEYAVQANSAKSEFLSRMSHELRTPLNAIIGFAQLLESDEQLPLHESQLDSLHEILKAGNHLLDLIDEVLDLAKIEAGKIQLHIEDMPIIDVMLDSYSMMIPMAESRNIHLDFKIGQCENIYINADRTKLKQVMFNLMSNAIKYNQPEGEVHVSCEACGTHRVRLKVTDTGIGIPKARQADLFKAFNRLGAEAGDEEGTGIGLMISKKIVEMMGGELDFQSEEGKGSSFWVEMSTENAISSEQQLNSSASNSKIR